MGIIINDTITLNSGLSVSNTYVSLARQPVSILKTVPYLDEENTAWIATITYNIWANKSAADTNKPPLQTDFIKTNIDVSRPIIPEVYNAIKAKYTSTTDC